MSEREVYDVAIVGAGHNAAREIIKDFRRGRLKR
jgi:hypothetical protein